MTTTAEHCPKCGAELLEEAAFCHECGHGIGVDLASEDVIHCIGCGTVLIEGAPFCHACGAPRGEVRRQRGSEADAVRGCEERASVPKPASPPTAELDDETVDGEEDGSEERRSFLRYAIFGAGVLAVLVATIGFAMCASGGNGVTGTWYTYGTDMYNHERYHEISFYANGSGTVQALNLNDEVSFKWAYDGGKINVTTSKGKKMTWELSKDGEQLLAGEQIYYRNKASAKDHAKR